MDGKLAIVAYLAMHKRTNAWRRKNMGVEIDFEMEVFCVLPLFGLQKNFCCWGLVKPVGTSPRELSHVEWLDQVIPRLVLVCSYKYIRARLKTKMWDTYITH